MYIDAELVVDEEALVVVSDYVELTECTDFASESRLGLLCFCRSLKAPTVSARLQLWEHRCVGMCGLNGCVG